jgi:glycosyltransferase involved in cell wall biosynthesis
MIDISIIVCTYKRYVLLKNCLEHLARMSEVENTTYELLIVENTPAVHRQDLTWVEKYKHARVIVEEVEGLSTARNAGIKASKGQIITFLDDDAEVHPDWLKQIAFAFDNHPPALLLGGKVVAKYADAPKPLWLSLQCEQLLSCIDWGAATRLLIDTQWVAGANLSYRRIVFDTYGLFKTSLGRKGDSSLLSNEEIELNQRIPKISRYYCGQAVVDHLIPVSRLDRQWFRRRIFWQAISDVLAGLVSADAAKYHFRQYVQGTLRVPAEFRTAKALFYDCELQEEFDHQLRQIYSQTIALATGENNWHEAAL